MAIALQCLPCSLTKKNSLLGQFLPVVSLYWERVEVITSFPAQLTLSSTGKDPKEHSLLSYATE
eukprot:731512-Ditylum_brightwellii.AAC.1